MKQSKISFRIQPLFWLLAALIGWLNSIEIYQVLIWMAVIFVSVSFHELGHALTAVCFKQRARIELVIMGGVTSYFGRPLKFWQQFLIVLNGPIFGLLLFVLSSLLLSLNLWNNASYIAFLDISRLVNLFWTVINLLPVLPLDGGQLVRIFLEGVFGVKGYRSALFIGMAFSLAVAVFFFLKGGFLIGALFFLFAFQSFDLWRKSRLIAPSDRKEENMRKIQQVERAIQQGHKEEAKKMLEELLKTVEKKSVIALLAYQHLAFLALEEKDWTTVYRLLLPIKQDLSDETKLVLHKAAFEKQDFLVVKEFSSECFKLNDSFDVALINAKAFAALGEARPAGGWLHTALEKSEIELASIMQDPVFEKVKDNPLFLEFFTDL